MSPTAQRDRFMRMNAGQWRFYEWLNMYEDSKLATLYLLLWC
jgi:hypothetical protein